MRRVLIVGSGGAGKTTFARRLAAATGLPLVHLDALYWRPGWVAMGKPEWTRTVAEVIAGDAWIVDGNYGGTLDQRLAAADTAIFLDVPRLVCLRRVVARRLSGHRPEMAPDCPEHLTWEFLRWIWRYPHDTRPGLLAKLAASRVRVIHLRTRGDHDRLFAMVTGNTV